MSEKGYLSLDSSVLYRCNQKHFDKLLAKYGLGYTHLILLTEIYENEGVSMNELATLGVYDKGTITKSIQRLEQLSYVRVLSSDLDKRTKLLYTNDKAQEIMPDLYKMRSEWNSYLSSELSIEELEMYNMLQTKLINKARQYASVDSDDEVKFYGFQKLSLLDYPGYMAATLFTGGCNFRCPFCHNSSLVFLNENDAEISQEEVLDYLSKRSKVLDGVCISGGEPLLHHNIKDFIYKVRSLGLKVKLDTNGTNFKTLKELIDEKLVDYVAMDIKNSTDKYSLTVGLEKIDLSEIEKSKNYLLEGHVDYEFRTTIVKEFHEIEDITKLAMWIKGAKRLYLQNFVSRDTCIQSGLHEVDVDTLKQMKQEAQKYIENVEIRGVED